MIWATTPAPTVPPSRIAKRSPSSIIGLLREPGFRALYAQAREIVAETWLEIRRDPGGAGSCRNLESADARRRRDEAARGSSDALPAAIIQPQ
jgi:hypothetical protein